MFYVKIGRFARLHSARNGDDTEKATGVPKE
jgi:hypothetical protein